MSTVDEDKQSGERASGERVVEELKALLDLLAGKAQNYLQGLDVERDAECSSSAPCGWCPVCAAMAFARGQRPELSARLAEQLTGLVALLRQVVEEQRPAGTPDASSEPSSESSTVQHIDVHRVRGSVLGEFG